MNPFKFVWRRPFFTLILIAAAISAGVFGLNKMRADTYPLRKTPKIYVYMDQISAKAHQTKGFIVGKYETYFRKKEAEVHEVEHKILVTNPMVKDVIVTQEYVCQIHSCREIDVQAFDDGYLEAISVKEGQAVNKGDLMFQIVPVLYQATLDAETAKVQLAQLEYNNTRRLYEGDPLAASHTAQPVVSLNEVWLFKAKLAEAEAKRKKAEAEFNFAAIKAPFNGIVDRLLKQQGSLIKKEDILTTLSDNSLMWVYFNLPEKRYLEYMAEVGQSQQSPVIELRLANLNLFPETGKIGAIEAKFNNETGNIKFRADFPNPNRLLRHGQTGTVVISRDLKKALLIPQRATFETLAKRYVYVLDKENKVRQREVTIKTELDDIFVIEKGVAMTDKIVYEGVRQVREGEKVEYEFLSQEEIMKNPKFHAE